LHLLDLNIVIIMIIYITISISIAFAGWRFFYLLINWLSIYKWLNTNS